MKKIFVLMICVLILQDAGAAEIRPADIEYRYEGMADSGNLSHGFMIREQETKRIKLKIKSATPIAIKFSQPGNEKPLQEIQSADAENKTIDSEAVKIKSSQPIPINFDKKTAAANSSPSEEKASSYPSCKKNIVFFPLNISRIRNSERDQIKQFINCIKGKEVKVTGYTCKIGGKFYNDKLAKARALNVAEYLQQKGVVVKEISGEGQQDYISGVDHVNRRVEIEQR
jgi:outer membrane protein OmpA-like peptidoglycan-associated protein